MTEFFTTEIARSAWPLAASKTAGSVLGGVAGNGNDHQTGKGLRQAQALHRRVERGDEPLGHESGSDPGQQQEEHAAAQRERSRPGLLGGCFGREDIALLGVLGAQVGSEPGGVDNEQQHGAEAEIATGRAPLARSCDAVREARGAR